MGQTGNEALFIPRWGTTGLLVLLVIQIHPLLDSCKADGKQASFKGPD